MTDRNDAETPAAPPPPAREKGEREDFGYEGSRVPWLLILLWAAYFGWGLYYLVRWIPDSWQEWFSR